MLSDSTPGRATPGGAECPLNRSMLGTKSSSCEQAAIFDQECFRKETRLQRMCHQRALPGHQFMIAKKREGRHPTREGGKRRRMVRMKPRRSATGHRREVRGPGE